MQRGCASGADQDFVRRDLLRSPAVGDAEDFFRAALLDARDIASGDDSHSVAAHRGGDPYRGVAILANQDLRCDFEQRHFRAEPAKRLRQFASKRPRADHREPARQSGYREDRLVGEIARLRQSLERRRDRARPGRDRRAREAQRRIAHLDRVGTAEARIADEHVHAQRSEACGGVVGGELRAQSAHPLHHRGKIHAHFAGYDHSVVCRSPRRRRHSRGADNCLGGNASEVQAVPAHQSAFHNRDFRPQSRRAGGGHQPGGSGPDHDHVIARGGGGIFPILGAHAREQPLVMLIERSHGQRLWSHPALPLVAIHRLKHVLPALIIRGFIR